MTWPPGSAAPHPRDHPARREDQARLAVVHDLRQALRSGSVERVAPLLHRRATLVVDSGGLAVAPVEPVHGRTAVSETLVDVCRNAAGSLARVVSANAEPALLLCDDGRARAVIFVRPRRRRLLVVWVVLNPEKLRRWHGH